MGRLVLLSAIIASAAALDNGAADTPPLGWCSWQRYRCAIACNDSTSTDCFNERLIRDTADAMAASPLKAAGYEYVALDDCKTSRSPMPRLSLPQLHQLVSLDSQPDTGKPRVQAGRGRAASTGTSCPTLNAFQVA